MIKKDLNEKTNASEGLRQELKVLFYVYPPYPIACSHLFGSEENTFACSAILFRRESLFHG